MTFVGTRPEVEKYVKKYTPEMMAIMIVKEKCHVFMKKVF